MKICVIVQKWERRGPLGNVTPDGYSIHPDELGFVRYLEDHKSKLLVQTPEEHESPCGPPYWADVEVEVDEDIGDGKRLYDRYPSRPGEEGQP